MLKRLSVVLIAACVLISLNQGYAQTVEEHLANAQQEADVWNFDIAIDHYTKALALDQSSAQVYFLRGIARQETGDHAGALSDFDKALEMNPRELEYLYARGYLKYYDQDYRGAVADFDGYLELEPGTENILQLRGQARYQLADFPGAIADYSLAIEQNPLNPESFYLRAFALLDHKDYDGAISDFTAVMDMEPLEGYDFDQRDISLVRRANVKLEARMYEEAIADCGLAIDRDGQNIEASYIRGACRVELGRNREAIEDLDFVLEYYPKAEVYQLRGKAKAAMGDPGGAKIDFAKAEELGVE